jgi:hypothetical protein
VPFALSVSVCMMPNDAETRQRLGSRRAEPRHRISSFRPFEMWSRPGKAK